MVVTVTDSMPRSTRGAERPLSRAMVLLTGISIFPTQSGDLSLLPAEAQLHAIGGLPARLEMTTPTPPSYLEFMSPAGQFEPSVTFAFNWSNAGLAQTQGSDPALASLLNSTVSNTPEQFGVGGGDVSSPATDSAQAPTWIRTACEQLHTGAEASTAISTSALPVQLAENIPAQLSQDSTGYMSDLPSQDPAGGWCRAAALPFEYSGPLADRAFWTPVVVVLFGVAVLWLSRGVSLPP